ncbi:MAG: DUF624 domain-containing protein [Lachnospiraceae bacterium]|jgi:uncharacterized membrane protein YesL|nr:DUF624 domain-containing protein [Lachnospiraceae bacterium]
MELNDVFNSENRFFSAMNKLWDLIVLNFLFFLTVILGIGPAASALYYAVAKNIRKSRSYAVKSYFHAFAMNFKQGFIIGIFQLLGALSLWYCYAFASSMDGQETIAQIYFTVWIVFTALYLFISAYVYPILSRFSMPVKKMLKMAFVISLRHLPSSLLITLIFAAEVFLIWLFNPASIPLVLIFGASGYVLLKSLIMEKILRKYTPKPAEGEEESTDAWYLE